MILVLLSLLTINDEFLLIHVVEIRVKVTRLSVWRVSFKELA